MKYAMSLNENSTLFSLSLRPQKNPHQVRRSWLRNINLKLCLRLKPQIRNLAMTHILHVPSFVWSKHGLWYIQLFLELTSFPNHSKIFTDGSKCSEKVAAAAAADGNFQNPSLCSLADNCSIYTAELHDVHLVLKRICQSFLMLSDSLSILKSIGNCKCDSPL